MSIQSTLFRLLRQSGTGPRHRQPRQAHHGVTIGIPNWNHEFLLARSIYSAMKAAQVLQERGIDAEVLVTDDASRDGSTTLLRQFESIYYEKGLRVLSHQQNSGLGPSRNILLLRATYRYILFLDADNEIVPENLPIFLQAIIDTQAAVVYGNLIIKRQGQDSIPGFHSNQSYTDHIFDANYIDNMALYDRIQVSEMGGYENQLVEDWELLNHLATNGRLVVFVPALFGLYYEYQSSMVREVDREHHLKINTRMKRVYDQFGMRKQQIIKTRHLRYHPDIGYII